MWRHFLYSLAVFTAFPASSLDVVITCADEQRVLLAPCIASVRANVQDLSRVLVVSERPLTDQAQWIPFSDFPFQRQAWLDAIPFLTSYDRQSASTTCWPTLQQLYKLYAGDVVDDLSSPYLTLEPPVLLLQPLASQHADGTPWQYLDQRVDLPIYAHMSRLVPGLRRLVPGQALPSLQLFDRTDIAQLRSEVEAMHQKPFWQATAACIQSIDWLRGPCSLENVVVNYRRRARKPCHYAAVQWSRINDEEEIHAAKARGDLFVLCNSRTN